MQYLLNEIYDHVTPLAFGGRDVFERLVLSVLSTKLNKLYEEFFTNIEKYDKSQFLKLLQWICFAKNF